MRIHPFSLVQTALLAFCFIACSSDDSKENNGTGGSKGGSTANGGSTATGGSTLTGGSTQKGGTTATGGSTGSGTTAVKGGSTTIGGTTATGGSTTTTGGATATGGSTATTGGATATGGSTTVSSGKLKPRMVALTDISTWETDDHESMTRLLAHADLFEIEGLIYTTGYSIDGFIEGVPDLEIKKGFINIIHNVINAYEKDLPNLLKRSGQTGHASDDGKQEIGYWPSPKYLRDRTMYGSGYRGQKFLGEKNISDGSNQLIKLAAENDDRPLWVTVWGGGNTMAQAIWQLQKKGDAEELKNFLRKTRVYAITDQDRTYTGSEPLSYSAHGWMRQQAGKDLLFIWDECAWKAHNNTGVKNWGQYTSNIQGHGNLGSQYPKYAYGVEGDTPSFLYIMPNGLNDPDDPSQVSWGGNFKGDANNLWQGAGSCGSNFGKYYPAAFNNFAARMDWAKEGAGNRNPVVSIDGDTGYQVLKKTTKAGTPVTLDASKTTDPDGNTLKFNWWVQTDATNAYSGQVNITNATTNTVSVAIPADSAGKKIHVVCEVTDDGTPSLSAYRRIVFEPN